MRYNHNGVISEITSLPGCDQIAVFHNTWLPYDERKKGKGGPAHETRIDEARKLGYDFLICTVSSTNDVEKHILEKYNWKMLGGYRSAKTCHNVELWGKLIGEPLVTQFCDSCGAKNEECDKCTHCNPHDGKPDFGQCEKHPKCQEEYEYCTCAMKAGWDCKSEGCGRDCNITHAPHCANSVK